MTRGDTEQDGDNRVTSSCPDIGVGDQMEGAQFQKSPSINVP